MRMKRFIKVALAILLSAIILFGVLSLVACDRKYDEEEVVSAAKALLEKASILNQIYYGGGINYN